MENTDTLTGIIAWFSAKKGFGFITRDDNKTDIFVHYSAINMPGFKNLMSGDKVSFSEDTSFNGKLVATNVLLLERTK